jgi:hypothetical protein
VVVVANKNHRGAIPFVERSDRRSGMGVVGSNTGVCGEWDETIGGISDGDNEGAGTSDGERIGIVD